MANAKKCDRCGVLYEQPPIVPNIRVFDYKHLFEDRRLDFCKNCQGELENWLVGEKNG